MVRINSRLRRCLWDALGVPMVFGVVVLVAVLCNHLLAKWA